MKTWLKRRRDEALISRPSFVSSSPGIVTHAVWPISSAITSAEDASASLRPMVIQAGAQPLRQFLRAMVDAVTDRTRLIAISHVSWVTGNSLEPEWVKAQTGLPILVDGAQSAGVIPVEAGGFDF